MQVKSEIIQIKKTDNITIEYVEQELIKRNINPLRWAIVNVSDNMYTISVANLKTER